MTNLMMASLFCPEIRQTNESIRNINAESFFQKTICYR